MGQTQSSAGKVRPIELNVVDVFSGVGGISMGFMWAVGASRLRFRPRLMVDSDPEARETASRNFPEIPFWKADLHQVSGAQVREWAQLGKDEELHVLVGGPPCQGFSYAGKRALEDDRNALLTDFLRLVKELRPLVALMENVPVILTAYDGAFIQDVSERLTSLGYSNSADVLIASDYGVPQLRKRAFALAYRADLRVPPQFPPRTHERVPFASELLEAQERKRFEPDKSSYISVEEAIGDLPSIIAGGGDEATFYPTPPMSAYQEWARRESIAIFNHRARNHSGAYLEKISVIKEGGRNATLDPSERFSDNYYSQAYARLHRKGIGQTITTCFGNPGSGRFTHYNDLRSITVREAARFQSFPDRFVFHGHQSSQMRHVGNAVPPLLAKAIAEQILSDLAAAGVGELRGPGRPKQVISESPKEQRSRIMRAVHSKHTTPELDLRKALWKAGIRGFRRHLKNLPGCPDFAFPAVKLAVFVDGCFWHGCPTCYREPKSHKKYWILKVKRNRERDATVSRECRDRGWRVLRIWEHQVAQGVEGVCRRIGRILDRGKGSRKRAATRAKAR